MAEEKAVGITSTAKRLIRGGDAPPAHWRDDPALTRLQARRDELAAQCDQTSLELRRLNLALIETRDQAIAANVGEALDPEGHAGAVQAAEGEVVAAEDALRAAQNRLTGLSGALAALEDSMVDAEAKARQAHAERMVAAYREVVGRLFGLLREAAVVNAEMAALARQIDDQFQEPGPLRRAGLPWLPPFNALDVTNSPRNAGGSPYCRWLGLMIEGGILTADVLKSERWADEAVKSGWPFRDAMDLIRPAKGA